MWEYDKNSAINMIGSHKGKVIQNWQVFSEILFKNLQRHDNDKLVPSNLEKYTNLLNDLSNPEKDAERTEIHNKNNKHHIEWFIKWLDKNWSDLFDLSEMICDQVAAAIARNAEFDDIFEQNKNWYMKKWMPEPLAIICANTFTKLRNKLK